MPRKDDSPFGCPLPGDGRKITHHITEEAEQDQVEEPVDGSAREPLFCTQKLTANTAGFEPVIVQTSFLREVILTLISQVAHFRYLETVRRGSI